MVKLSLDLISIIIVVVKKKAAMKIEHTPQPFNRKLKAVILNSGSIYIRNTDNAKKPIYFGFNGTRAPTMGQTTLERLLSIEGATPVYEDEELVITL